MLPSWCGVLALCGVLLAAPRADAYSVLAHEANIDAAWDRGIKPLLVRRLPRATEADLTRARAYAYGGSVIQDFGYYPFGNHFFTNLVHYVRSGDFVEALVRESRTVDELAFALGALSHYAADTVGHAVAVNRAVPLMFPELERKYGSEVTYAESPATHVLVEFSFDVVQVAGSRYLPDAYHQFIGFQVAKPVLERAFRDTYGLELTDVFRDLDLAIGTYRRAASEIIPQITEAAWRDKHDEITKLLPDVQRDRFVFRLSRHEYESEFGTKYQRRGWLGRFLTVIYKLVPKVGPLRPLKFKTPTREAEALFVESLKQTRERYRSSLAALGRGALDLANADFDTGKRARYGEYPLADKTYAQLLDQLADRKFAHVSPDLRADVTRFYGQPENLSATDRHERKRVERVRQRLVALRAQM